MTTKTRIRIRWGETLTAACALALMVGVHIGAWLSAGN